MSKYFITGIDTDIGKTFVSLGLCRSLNEKGIKVGYFKPLQSGAYKEGNILKAPDIEEIKKHISIPCGCSYLLKGEVSPYLASKLSNVEIDINKIKQDIDKFSDSLDISIIEGAGGLYCPLTKNKTFADLIKELNIPAILVATPHLGRLNHILMSIECAKKKEIQIKGIILNKMPKNPNLSESHFIEELKDFCSTDILGIIPEDKNYSFEAFKNINLL